MKFLINISLSIFLSANCFAQQGNYTYAEDDLIYVNVDVKPEYPGGDLAIRRFIAENIIYPQIALENYIQGTVVVLFEVKKSGEVGKVEVTKTVDPLLDREAVRVVKKLNKFQAAIKDGNVVNSWYSIPIVFKIKE